MTARTILHVDLARVDLDERVTVNVPLHFRGAPIGVKEEGGVLHTAITDLEVECPVMAIPDGIRINIAELKIGDGITVGQLSLPEGVTCEMPADQLVVHVVPPKGEEEEAVAEEEGPAEPEVIAKGKEAEEGEGGEEAPE